MEALEISTKLWDAYSRLDEILLEDIEKYIPGQAKRLNQKIDAAMGLIYKTATALDATFGE